LSVDSSSEKAALAPTRSITRPTMAPTPRAVSCVSISLKVASNIVLNSGVDADATASRSRPRVSGLWPSTNPRAVTARRSRGKMEKTA